jgi:hypothetical protein
MCATYATFAFAYIAHRYLADFIPLGVLASLAGFHLVLRWTSARPRRAGIVAAWAALGLLAATSLWFNVGLGVIYGRAFARSSDHDLASFVAFQYDVYNRFPGGARPYVGTGSRLPAPKKGTTFVLGRCRALYWSDGSTWHVLERSESGGRFRLRVGFPASPTGWEPLVVNVRRGPAQYLAVRVLPGNRAQFAYGVIFPEAPVPIRPGRIYDLEVLMDATPGSPTQGTVNVTLDGRRAWGSVLPNAIITEPLRPLRDVTVGRSHDIPGLAPLFTGTLERLPAETSLCRKLARDSDT